MPTHESRDFVDIDHLVKQRDVAEQACRELVPIVRALYALCGENPEAQTLTAEAERIAERLCV